MNINLIDYFEHTVSLFPEKTAISDSVSSLSFKELKQSATQIATHICKEIEEINRPVAILLPKSNNAIASFLATLYSGNCYAPLDVKNPAPRILAILETLNPIAIITTSAYLEQLGNYHSSIIINLDDIKDSKAGMPTFLYKKCIDTDPAYIIHTSGSTGLPKGVVISHRSIFDYIHWAIDTFTITENEVIGNQAPFVFDNSTLDIYLMLFTGATLELIPEELFVFPKKLLDYLETQNINFVFWVPSLLVHIANMQLLDTTVLPSLKKILFAGEVMPTKSLNYWINKLSPDTLFANLYGPTEITVDCTYYIIDRAFKDNEVLPIGQPCRNTDILILNEAQQLCKPNEHGELCVRGTSLALGYWNNFEKTNSVFIQNPLNTSYPEKIYKTGDVVFKDDNGNIVFVGRKDRQIKHMGYRIELDEIEHVLLSTFSNLNACVAYHEEKKEIVVFYKADSEIPVKEFRIKLARVLSKYMMPTKYFKIEDLPLTASGKIDRNSLKKTLLLCE